QRQRFGDRIAQKIVERNLLKDHPAIGVAQVAPREGKARVTVYGYRHMMGPQEIRDVTAQAERGEEVVVSKEELVAAPEEEQGAIVEAAEEATEESPATAKEPPPEYYKKEGKEPAK
nr:hypothetical protein [Burkholderiales bacterium]